MEQACVSIPSTVSPAISLFADHLLRLSFGLRFTPQLYHEVVPVKAHYYYSSVSSKAFYQKLFLLPIVCPFSFSLAS